MKPSLNQSHGRDTLHTKLLTDSPVSERTAFDTNSVETVKETNQSVCSVDDFTGGPIYQNQSFAVQSEQHNFDQNIDFNRSITATPADSSCGFHNTLSVLEDHLNKNKTLNLCEKQIEHLLVQNKYDVVQHDNSLIDIPINIHENSITIVKNDSNSNDKKFTSPLDQKLAEIGRQNSMWDKAIPSDHLKYSSALVDSRLLAKQSTEGVQDLNEYIYHVARLRNGQLYLRVRRSLCLDQGILNYCIDS